MSRERATLPRVTRCYRQGRLREVTSGPGATNVLTALGDACMDSVPIVVISGQVGASLIGTDAFQEADVVGASMPITKHSFLVTDPQDIPAPPR